MRAPLSPTQHPKPPWMASRRRGRGLPPPPASRMRRGRETLRLNHRGRKTPSESDRNRLTPTAAPCTIRGPPYSPTRHVIPSTSISNDHPRADIRLQAQPNCSTTCLVPVGPEAIPLGPNSVWRAVWGDSKRTPQWSDTARTLEILLFVSSASDPQARAPAPSGVLRRAALPSGDIVGYYSWLNPRARWTTDSVPQ